MAVVRRYAAGDVETRRAGHDRKALAQGRTGIGEDEISFQPRRARKNRRGGVWQEALDPGRHSELEPPRITLPRQRRIAVGADIGAGSENKPRGEGIERALAVDVEVDRRQAGELDEMRDQPALRLACRTRSPGRCRPRRPDRRRVRRPSRRSDEKRSVSPGRSSPAASIGHASDR
jgi:hypothetical protein